MAVLVITFIEIGSFRKCRTVLILSTAFVRLGAALFQLLLFQLGKLGLQVREILLSISGLSSNLPGILELFVGALH